MELRIGLARIVYDPFQVPSYFAPGLGGDVRGRWQLMVEACMCTRVILG